jgi:hypothetical protein
MSSIDPESFDPEGACVKNRESTPLRDGLLAGALAVAFGLVGVHFSHAFEEFFGVGTFNFRGCGTFASASRGG